MSWLLVPDPCSQCRSGSNNSYVCSSFRTLLYRWPSPMFLRKLPEISFPTYFVPLPGTEKTICEKAFWRDREGEHKLFICFVKLWQTFLAFALCPLSTDILFVSYRSKYITGASLDVNGGLVWRLRCCFPPNFFFFSLPEKTNVQKILNTTFCYSNRQFPGAEGEIKQFILKIKNIQKTTCFDLYHFRICQQGTFYNQNRRKISALNCFLLQRQLRIPDPRVQIWAHLHNKETSFED